MLKDAALKHLHVDTINRLPNEIRSFYWEKSEGDENTLRCEYKYTIIYNSIIANFMRVGISLKTSRDMQRHR